MSLGFIGIDYYWVALIAVFFSSLSVVVDKILASSWFDSGLSAAFVSAVPKTVVGLVLVFIFRSELNLLIVFKGVLIAILYYISFAISFKVLESKDATKLQPVSALSNVFLVFLAIVFLGRLLSLDIYIGILMVTLGALISLSITTKGRFDLNKKMGLYLVSVVLVSVYSFSVEIITRGNLNPLLLYGIYDSFSLVILSPLLLRRKVRYEVSNVFRNSLKLVKVFVLKILAPVSIALYFLSLSRGPVEIVGSIFSLSSVGALIIFVVLSRIGYSYEQNMESKDIFKKTLAVVMAFIGLLLLKGYF